MPWSSHNKFRIDESSQTGLQVSSQSERKEVDSGAGLVLGGQEIDELPDVVSADRFD